VSAGGGIIFGGPTTLTHLTVANGKVLGGAGGAAGEAGASGLGDATSGAIGAPGADAPQAIGVGGAGIFGSNGGVVSRTLLANNDGKNCAGLFTSGGFNLSDDASCAAIFTQPTDLPPNTDPMIGPLALNPPGHTPTHALVFGSPAVDAIPVASCVANEDQRGVFRPQLNGCDIGAYELTAPESAPALGHDALLLLAGLLATAGMFTLRRRPARAS
jgi:hypothetical protein